MKIANILLWQSAFISLMMAALSSLRTVNAGQIFGESIVVNYNYDGYPEQITLLVQFESSLTTYEAMRIQLPTNLGPYNQVFSNIYEQDNNLLLAGNVMADVSSTNNYYNFAYQANLLPNVAYRIEITFIMQIANNQVFNDPISMTTMSSLGANPIIYDYNPSLFYLYIAPSISTETLLIGIQLDTKPQEEYITDPGVIFSAFVDITPSLSNSQGGYYYIQIDVGSNVIGSATGADFSFVGKCQSVENKCDSTQNDPNCQVIYQVRSQCVINSSTGIIQFQQYDPIVANQPIRVIVEIQNPLFTSQRDIKVFSASINDMRPMEKGKKAIALRVSPVQISLLQLQYLWGIDSKESIYSPFQLFKAAAVPLAGPLNSVQVYFSIPTLVPEGSSLTVSLETGATGCIENSIITNLPVASSFSKVSCYFDTGFIRCINIGAFQDPTINYFIAAKIYYANAATNPQNYGGISITSQVVDTSGNTIPNVYLFQSALGQSMTLQLNTEFLDNANWHNPATWSLGTTQIISTPDDGTLSGVPNGINAILTGSLNTVGIIPSLGTTQQLVFFLNVPTSSIGTADGLYYRMSVLYNPSVVQFTSGFEKYGIDFAAYSNTDAKWELNQFTCYSQATKYCVWYNKPQLQVNAIELTYNSLISNPYAFIRFECGLTTAGVTRANCNNFQGMGTANTQGGAFSMRNVYFNSGFQSSLYPDDKLLDFIVVFEQKKYTDPVTVYSTVTTQLINAYTIQNYKLSNIKVSYVNLYSQTGAVKSNNGVYVPTMLRIGGTILRSESFNLDKIHVFLDQNVDASNFMENYINDKSDKTIGCSQATCQYFANAGVSFPTDTWLNQIKIEISNLPNIQNEFNILIPIKNLDSLLPTRIVIAFTSTTYSAFGLSGLDQVLNVFRVAGLPVNGKLQTPILTVNGLANNVVQQSAANAQFAEAGNTFDYKLDVTTVGVQNIPQTSLVGSGSTTLVTNQAGDAQMYGAGLTIASFTQNIFSISQIQFNVPPATGAQTCTYFWYKINYLSSPPVASRNGQYNYIVYCPIDDYTYKINNSATATSNFSVMINNPSFPGFFVNNFDLSQIFNYGFSNNKGSMIAFNKETQLVTQAPWVCTTNSIAASPFPASVGRQKIQFVIPWNDSDLNIDSTMLKGYASLTVRVTFTALTGITFVTSGPNVYCQNDQFTCAGTLSATGVDFLLTPILTTQVYTIERSQNIIITTFATIGTVAAPLTYTISILIPTWIAGANVLYGNALDTTNPVIYQNCGSLAFNVNAAPYGTALEITNLAFEILNVQARGTISFDFRSVSAREEFYSTSQYVFTLGFLQSADMINLLTIGNINCYVMERDYTNANSIFTVSHKWSSLLISATFTTITLTPQAAFTSPDSYQFKLVCVGGSATDGIITTGLTAAWSDGADTIQSTTTSVLQASLPNPIMTNIPFVTAPAIVQRLFASPGMEAHYKFQITIQTPLTVQSRIYIDFGVGFSPRINKYGRAECYITDMPTFDTQQGILTLTLCEIINNRRLRIFVNDLVSTTFYLDILGISMPQTLPLVSSSRPLHWIGVDDDGLLTNGIAVEGTLFDNFPTQGAFTAMTCSNVQTNRNIIRRAHTITFTIKTQRSNILATNIFYVDFPFQYDSISRGDVYPCTFSRNDTSTYPSTAASYVAAPNMASKCDFISLTRLRVQFSKDDDQTLSSTVEIYSLFVQNIVSPSQVVTGLKFLIFACQKANLNNIYLIASDYGASPLSYVAEVEKTDLSWSSVQLQQAQQNTVMTTSSYLYNYYSNFNYFNAYIGYYNCDMQLSPKSNSSSSFKASFQYSFAQYTSNFYFDNTVKTTETASTGQAVSQFKLGAQQSTTPGIYTLHPSKSSGDTLQQYMDLPPLNIVVSTNTCQINAASSTYSLPADGQTLPIIFDFTNCYPVQSISYTPSNDLPNSSQLIYDTTSYQNSIDGTQGNWQSNYRMIMIFMPLSANLIAVGTTINLSFTVGGYNLLSYSQPSNVVLTVTTALGAVVAPTPASIVLLSQSANSISVQFSCNQPSIVYYQVGLEDLTAPVYTDIIANLTSSRDFFSNSSDYTYFRQYGRLVIATANGNVQTTISSLQSSSVYNLYYFCVNQKPLASVAMKGSFQVASNGGYLLKINLYFQGQLSYAQNQDLTCALSQVFQLSYNRIVTDQNVYCGSSYPYFVKDTTQVYRKTAGTNGLFMYSYYILQNKTLVSDLVNLSIKETIQYNSFNTTLLGYTTNPYNYPILINPETEDILVQSQPAVTLSVSSYDTNYITLNYTISQQNGYIYIGVVAGGQNIPFNNFLSLVNYQSVVYFWSKYSPRNIQQQVTFTNLSPATTYTIFYAASNDNPSIQAMATSVLNIQVTTKTIQIVVDVSSPLLISTLFILLLSLLL